MSSELQLDVHHLNRWRRHLVNAYEVKAGMVFIAGKTVLSMPERFKVVCIPCKVLYKCSAFALPLTFTDISAVIKQNFVYRMPFRDIYQLSFHVPLLFRLHFLLHCRCLLYNQFYFLCYISFYVACAFVICLIKYLLTYSLTYFKQNLLWMSRDAWFLSKIFY